MRAVDRGNAAEAGIDGSGQPLTYSSYLRVPELLRLQRTLAPNDAPDEMLFIILQQAQELWFKQILFDLDRVIRLLHEGQIDAAARLVERCARVLHVLSEEVEVMETLPPQEFQRFRHVLKTASGFESEQFRELELASGLEDESHQRIVQKFVDDDEMRERRPESLHDAWLDKLAELTDDPAEALLKVYEHPDDHAELYRLADALADYDLRFAAWRFHHLMLVERVIGNRATGTGGSSGHGYLGRTLQYRFFPELWEARNRLTEKHAHQS